MKFKEMTWKELQKDFKNKLDNMSTQELVNSLIKYTEKGDK